MNTNRLENLIEKGNQVLKSHKPNPPNVIGFPTLDTGLFNVWRAQSISFISELVGKSHEYYISFDKNVEQGYKSNVESGIGILKIIMEDYNNGYFKAVKSNSDDTLQNLERIFERFHRIVRQFRNRHDDRASFEINDEYDVQDLIHSLLILFFDDIRAEEWTPSYAGKSSRVDFLLKNEKVVIEIKKTRKTLKASDLGNQLIEDIARYRSHPDCESLVCFTYDPEGWILNPNGIENDLSKTDEDMTVKVFIRPH